IANSTAQVARQMMEEVRARTSGLFNVNVFCHQPARRDAEREAGWLEHLRPFFEEFDAEPPKQLREINRSFLADEEVFRMLLETRPRSGGFPLGRPLIHHLPARGRAAARPRATPTS